MSKQELAPIVEGETLLIIDGHALIYRAFHAFPPLTTDSGKIVGAVYGFLRVLLVVLKQLTPAYWLIAFDHPAPTKRKQEFAFYKANRPEMPVELQEQIVLIEEAVAHLAIPQFKIAGIEADDLIGTISRLVSKEDLARVFILTGDKDSFQLVNEKVHVLMPNVGRARGRTSKEPLIEFGPVQVEQKMGVSPALIVDYKALAGDSADNISGVPGIGDKTAVNLIQKYGNLEKIYQLLDQEQLNGERSGIIKKLLDGREAAFISKKLATIDCEIDLAFDLAKCKVCCYQKDDMAIFLQNLGFHSLLKLLPADDFELNMQQALF